MVGRTRDWHRNGALNLGSTGVRGVSVFGGSPRSTWQHKTSRPPSVPSSNLSMRTGPRGVPGAQLSTASALSSIRAGSPLTSSHVLNGSARALRCAAWSRLTATWRARSIPIPRCGIVQPCVVRVAPISGNQNLGSRLVPRATWNVNAGAESTRVTLHQGCRIEFLFGTLPMSIQWIL